MVHMNWLSVTEISQTNKDAINLQPNQAHLARKCQVFDSVGWPRLYVCDEVIVHQ
jgi:hypothetical protein